MNRRKFITAGVALSATGLAGCKLSVEQGLFNECRSVAGQAVLRHPDVLRAWEGIRADQVWDCHTHLFGNGASGQGLWVNPDFDQPRNPVGKVRRAMFANAGCVAKSTETMDQDMVARLTALVDTLPVGAKVMLLAFDYTHDEAGRRQEKLSTFHVSHAYAKRIVASRPDRFEWIASVHPYREDAIAALESAKADGARAVKWLPPTMGIDMGHPRCVPFYDAMKRLDIPLLVHLGEEQAVPGAERHDLGNPLLARHPLGRGVRVIAAHCASLGESPDLEVSANADKAPQVTNISLFARLMADRNYSGLLFGDISAVTQANRAGALPIILGTRAWDGRLLNGSDYPLPGIMPLFSPNAMMSAGLLEERALPVIRELRHVNPLMFDFVVKRSLRFQGQAIPASTFETRPFFLRTA